MYKSDACSVQALSKILLQRIQFPQVTRLNKNVPITCASSKNTQGVVDRHDWWNFEKSKKHTAWQQVEILQSFDETL